MVEIPPFGSRWRHLKRGSTYVVLMSGIIEATNQICLIYQSEADGRVWVRPAREFMDGRFERIE